MARKTTYYSYKRRERRCNCNFHALCDFETHEEHHTNNGNARVSGHHSHLRVKITYFVHTRKTNGTAVREGQNYCQSLQPLTETIYRLPTARFLSIFQNYSHEFIFDFTNGTSHPPVASAGIPHAAARFVTRITWLPVSSP